MRTLRQILKPLTDAPRGHLADGRPMGLGLASALYAQQVRCDAYLEARTAGGDARRHEALDGDRHADTH